MFRALQIALLIAVGVAFVLYSIWAAENPSPRLIAAVAAIIAYISILWLVFHANPDGWRRASAVWTFRALASTPARAALSLLVALVAAVVFAVVLFKPKPKTPNFVIEVFDGGRANPVNGVAVQLRNLISDERHEGVTADGAGVRFHVASTGLWQAAIVLTEGADRKSATRAPEDVETLPHAQVIDLDDIQANDWVTTAGAPAPIEFASARVEAASAVRTVSAALRSADRNCLTGHSPYGLLRAEIIVCRQPYAVGFDPERRLARWVAYAVNPAETTLRRRDVPYLPDPEIAAGVQASAEAYAQNPYDRGHLVSRHDIGGWGETGEDQVFYMSVIAPQLDVLNREAWTQIEQRTLEAARETAEDSYVVAGPAFVPPPGQANVSYAVLADEVAVPTHFFRIAYQGHADAPARVMAFLVPNTEEAQRGDISRFLTSVDVVEAVTGLDFFTTLDASRQAGLESGKTTLW